MLVGATHLAVLPALPLPAPAAVPSLLSSSPPAHAEAQAPWQPPSPSQGDLFGSPRWWWDPPKAEQAAPSWDTCFSKGHRAHSAALPQLSHIQGLSGVNRVGGWRGL